MKSIKLIVTVALLIICNTTQAQLGRRLQEAVQNATERIAPSQPAEQPAAQPANTNTSAASNNRAASTSFVAMTPQQIIAQCPALPPVDKLVNELNVKAFGPDIDAFLRQIENLRNNTENILAAANEAVEAVKQEDADRVTQRYTGHTEAELANMNDAQQEAMINNMLSSMGMGNMNLAQIQAMDGKSDAEIMAQMSQSGVTVGGLTIDEINAMENMTDAQKQAYMQQGDRQQRVDAYRNSGQAQEAVKRGDEAAVLMQTMTEMQSITGRWMEFEAQLAREREEIAKQIAAIDDRYATQVAAVPRTKFIEYCDGPGTTYTEAEQKAKDDLIARCRTEQYTLLRSYVIKMQESIVAIMNATVPRYDELQKQHLTASGMTSTAQLTPSTGYGFATSYLDAAGSVISLPGIEIFGIESKIVW